jgi:hypothetical protein
VADVREEVEVVVDVVVVDVGLADVVVVVVWFA